jgi:hypothetical protein
MLNLFQHPTGQVVHFAYFIPSMWGADPNDSRDGMTGGYIFFALYFGLYLLKKILRWRSE